MKKFGVVGLFLLLFMLIADNSYAYVDPGFTGSFFQVIYFIVFGVLFGWVCKPILFIKSFFKKDVPVQEEEKKED